MEADEIRRLEEAQQRGGGEPAKLFFFTAASGLASDHMRTSLLDGIPLAQLASLSDVYPELKRHADNGLVYAWGARPGDRAEQKWQRLNPGDICLIYAGEHRFALWGRVYAKARSESVARAIWGEHKGAIWECMYFLDPVAPLDAERAPVVAALGYKEKFIPQGFEIPRETVQRKIRDEHSTLVQFLESLGAQSARTSGQAAHTAVAREGEAGPGDDPALAVLLEGATDAKALAKIRREQQKLRRRLLGKRSSAECALCGREFPKSCLRVAHIKKRSDCSDAERLRTDNLMLACTLGCDHLFELGFVYVDATGVVRRTPGREVTPDLDAAIASLAGRPCASHGKASEPYFAWHRSNLAP